MEMTNCQLCSTISRTNGEDPIGTARHSDVWIILERSLPWIPDRLKSDSMLQPVFMAMQTLFGQIIDRELWMRYGWDWLHYLKSEIAGDRDSAEPPDWVELRLEFAAPDNSDRGGYEARVEVAGMVETMQNSGEEPMQVKQYRVTKCERY